MHNFGKVDFSPHRLRHFPLPTVYVVKLSRHVRFRISVWDQGYNWVPEKVTKWCEVECGLSIVMTHEEVTHSDLVMVTVVGKLVLAGQWSALQNEASFQLIIGRTVRQACSRLECQ